MKQITTVAENKNFAAVDLGKLELLMKTTNGKVFLKKAINSTGIEISFGVLPAKTELPVFHYHKQNEEVYVILSGLGKFQVDDECFNISEGTVIRVSPLGIRGMINTSDEQMTYIVIQAKEGSLEQSTENDGVFTNVDKLWE